MPKYSFETIEQMLLKCVARGGEPELSFRLRGAEYQIWLYLTRKLAVKTQNLPCLLLARLKFLLKFRALLRLVFSSYLGVSRA